VLDCLSHGFLYKRNRREKLGISYETVHTYVRRIYEKLQVRTRTEAVAKFFADVRDKASLGSRGSGRSVGAWKSGLAIGFGNWLDLMALVLVS